MEVDLRSINKNMQKIIKIGVLLLMVGSVNATMMPRKNNNSNSNKGLARVNRELGIGRKQRQVKKLVLNEEEIINVLQCDDLATFKKVIWEKVCKIKDKALREACMYSSPKIVVHLIKEGASVDGKDTLGNTPLHWTVRMQKPKVVRLLIQARANVNQKDFLGRTPLYSTLRTGDISLAELLIEAGTNIDSKDRYNGDVIEYGLRLNTSEYSTAEEKENVLKVVDYIKSVKEIESTPGLVRSKQPV